MDFDYDKFWKDAKELLADCEKHNVGIMITGVDSTCRFTAMNKAYKEWKGIE